MQRVKVYRLNDEGTWDDKGTGQVSVEYLEADQCLGLIVISENNGTRLLLHRIKDGTSYQRQGEDTIITWNDVGIGTDIALSFQETTGCAQIWQNLMEIQQQQAGAAYQIGGGGVQQHDASFGGGNTSNGNNGSPRGGSNNVLSLHANRVGGIIDEYDAVTVGGRYEDFIPGSAGPHHLSVVPELPAPTFDTLPFIAKALGEVTLFQRDAVAGQLLRRGYLEGLIECFKRAEDLEDEESLHALYTIFRLAILLNDTNLFETLFSDDFILYVIGALEYNTDAPITNKANHRQFLLEQAQFKEVVPIADPTIKSKIQQTYRMNYVKDVVLPKILDDATFSTLSSLILFNSVEILVGLQSTVGFFEELFKRLKESEAGSEGWKDLVAFLQELCSLTRHLQASQRNQLLSRLVDLGLFDVMSSVLQTGNEESRLKATDILLAGVSHDPAPLRMYLKDPNHALFSQLVQTLLMSSDSGLQEQVLEIFKVLLDPDTMENPVEKDEFMDCFYEKHIGGIISAVVIAAEQPSSDNAPSPATINLLLELLCTCVVMHTFRIKYYILRTNALQKLLKLLKRKEKWIQAAAVRFLRICLGMRDEFYNRSVIKNNLLEQIITTFIDNGPTYNLLNSAILELFDFIRKENIKALIACVIESPQWPALAAIEYVDTFKALAGKHEQNLEGQQQGNTSLHNAHTSGNTSSGIAAAEARRLKGEKEEDRDEESYFSKEEDDDNAINIGPSLQQQQQQRHGSSGAKEKYFSISTAPRSHPIGSPPLGAGFNQPSYAAAQQLHQQQQQRQQEHDQLSPALPPLNLPPLPKRKVYDEDDDDEAAFFVKKPKTGGGGGIQLKSVVSLPVHVGVPASPAGDDNDNNDADAGRDDEAQVPIQIGATNGGGITLHATSPASFLPNLVDYGSDEDDGNGNDEPRRQ